MAVVYISFFVILAVVLITVSVGWAAIEARRKKKVVGMLETVAGKTPGVETTVLKDLGETREDGLTRLLANLNISKNIEAHIHQAGLDWTVEKLLYLPLAIVCGAIMFLAVFVLGATLCFWTVESVEVSSSFDDASSRT